MEARKAMRIFIFLTIFTMISDRLLFVIFPTYLIDKNFSATEIGIIFSFGALFLVMLRTFIGRLSDKYGRKNVLSLGLLISSVTTSIYPFISKLYQFAIVKGLQEVGITLKESVEDSIQADAFPKNERPRYLITLGKVFPLSRALAALVGIIVTTYLSLIYGFYIAAISMFIAFLVFFIFYKEDKIKTKSKAKDKKFNPLKYPNKVIFIALVGFLTSLVYGILYAPAFFILGEKTLGIAPNIIFLLLLMSYIVSTVFIHAAEKKAKNFGKKPVLVAATIFFAIFSFLYAASNIILFSLALLGIAITFYFWRISYKTIAMDSATPSERGEQLGFVKTMQGIGNILGPLAGGILIDAYSIQMPFIVGGFIFLSTTLLILKSL